MRVRIKGLAAVSAAALALAAAPAAAQSYDWAPQATDTGWASDFDTATQTFAGTYADTLTFEAMLGQYMSGGYFHSHGGGATFTISAIVDGLNQQIYASGPVAGDFGLSAIGPIAFSGGTVTGISLQSTSYVGQAFHGFYDQSFTLSAAGGAVPEPATWAMLLLGFMGIGYAMRTRAKGRTTVAYA
jgi:hypothetical protein